MKSYLVTGGAGFLGASLVHRLVEAGHRVRVLDDLSRGAARRLQDVSQAIEFIEGDIRDSSIVERATQGMDAVCHLAFINGTALFYSQPELVLDVGVRGILNILDASIRCGVGEFFLASSSEVYQTPPYVPTDELVPLSIPDPKNPRYSYAAGKMISEVLAINFGRSRFDRLVIFRPHNVFGPDMGWEHVIPEFVVRIKELCRGNSDPLPLTIQGTGSQTRAFIYVDDFTDALMQLLVDGQHLDIYNIGTTEERSIREVAELVGEHFGRKIEVIPGPEARGGTLRRCPDIAKLEKLGFQQLVSFEEGLGKTASWYDANSEQAPRFSH